MLGEIAQYDWANHIIMGKRNFMTVGLKVSIGGIYNIATVSEFWFDDIGPLQLCS